MSTFVIVAGLTFSLTIILILAFKAHNFDRKNDNQKLEEDIDNLGENIDREIKNLKRKIEEFEL